MLSALAPHGLLLLVPARGFGGFALASGLRLRGGCGCGLFLAMTLLLRASACLLRGFLFPLAAGGFLALLGRSFLVCAAQILRRFRRRLALPGDSLRIHPPGVFGRGFPFAD